MRQVMRERYADEDNGVLAEELGVTARAVFCQAQWLGLRKSAEYESARRSRCAKERGFASRLNSSSAIEKRSETIRGQFKSERARVMCGLEQKTHRHLRIEPAKRLVQRNRLQRLGYVVDEKALVAYWTEVTHRAVRLEKLKRGETRGSMKCWYDFAELPKK